LIYYNYASGSSEDIIDPSANELFLVKYHKVLTAEICFLCSPFHAAEQWSKKPLNVSTEHPARGYKLNDFSRRQLFVSSTGNPPEADK
jgi:hypothetical protein